MLVLSRKQKQAICIGDDIQITVVQVSGNRVRLAIEAPKHIAIHRDEIAKRLAKHEECPKPVQELVAAP